MKDYRQEICGQHWPVSKKRFCNKFCEGLYRCFSVAFFVIQFCVMWSIHPLVGIAANPSLQLQEEHIGNTGKEQVRLSINNPTEDIYLYRIFQRCVDVAENSWKEVTYEGGSIRPEPFRQNFSYSKNGSNTCRLPVKGVYKVSLFGGAGESFGEKAGGKGSLLEAGFFFESGQSLRLAAKGAGTGVKKGGLGIGLWKGEGDSKQYHILMIAGGGGAATKEKKGGAGGGSDGTNRRSVSLSDSLQMDISSGQNAAGDGSGGGGGYQGGNAGSLVAHTHILPKNAEKIGEGYSKSSECYGRLEAVVEEVECGVFILKPYAFYCDTCFDKYGPNSPDNEYTFWVGENHKKETGHEIKSSYYTVCDTCGVPEILEALGAPHNRFIQTDVYKLNCKKTYDLNTAAYGGSDYSLSKLGAIYKEKSFQMKLLSQKKGEHSGSAGAEIELISGAYNGQEEYLLPALDLRKPEAVDIKQMSFRCVGEGDNHILGYVTGREGQIVCSWVEPRDYGSSYQFRVEGYSPSAILENKGYGAIGDGVLQNGYWSDGDGFVAQDQVTCISGVVAYRYVQNNLSSSSVLMAGSTEIKSQALCVSIDASAGRYLHIVAVDGAGNVSDTTHIDLYGLAIPWPVETKALELTGERGIYRKDHRIYVCGDGVTDYQLQLSGLMKGVPRSTYQINYGVIEDEYGNAGYFYSENGEASSSAVTTTKQGDAPWLDRIRVKVVSRSLDKKQLDYQLVWTPTRTMSGSTYCLFPRAIALEKGRIPFSRVWSDASVDRGHGIEITVDGEEPVIQGFEALMDHERLIDRGRESLSLVLSAFDEISGLDISSFQAVIRNLDSGMERSYSPDAAGNIRLSLTEGGELDALRNGRLLVMVVAKDMVGNQRVLTNNSMVFDMDCKVTRCLEALDGESSFKRGESGILEIKSWGFVEQLEIIFPECFTQSHPELNQRIVYAHPAWKETEQIEFMVPLYLDGINNALDKDMDDSTTEYSLTVKAYKQGEYIELHPRIHLFQVGGTVLDDLRTILR